MDSEICLIRRCVRSKLRLDFIIILIFKRRIEVRSRRTRPNIVCLHDISQFSAYIKLSAENLPTHVNNTKKTKIATRLCEELKTDLNLEVLLRCWMAPCSHMTICSPSQLIFGWDECWTPHVFGSPKIRTSARAARHVGSVLSCVAG